jgi:hypothetical protein
LQLKRRKLDPKNVLVGEEFPFVFDVCSNGIKKAEKERQVLGKMEILEAIFFGFRRISKHFFKQVRMVSFLKQI